jgi:hypothetical protein
MPPPLTIDLVRIARQEQADLRVLYDTGQHRPLADLIHAAEYAQRTSAAGRRARTLGPASW